MRKSKLGAAVSFRYWIPTFSGPPRREYRDTEKSVDDPHTTPPDDRGDVCTHARTYARARARSHGHTAMHIQRGRPRKKRDTTKWRATGVWTLRAVKVVAYFTSWLRETFSSCRSCVHARTESGEGSPRSDMPSGCSFLRSSFRQDDARRRTMPFCVRGEQECGSCFASRELIIQIGLPSESESADSRPLNPALRTFSGLPIKINPTVLHLFSFVSIVEYSDDISIIRLYRVLKINLIPNV